VLSLFLVIIISGSCTPIAQLTGRARIPLRSYSHLEDTSPASFQGCWLVASLWPIPFNTRVMWHHILPT